MSNTSPESRLVARFEGDGRESSPEVQRAPSFLDLLMPGNQAFGQDVQSYRNAFEIGSHAFLVPETIAVELTPALPCARMPFTAPWCLGLANHRGDLVPLFDLAPLVDPDAPSEPGEYALLFGRGDEGAGFLIDRITTILLPTNIEPMPGETLGSLPVAACGDRIDTRSARYWQLNIDNLFAFLSDKANLLSSDLSPPGAALGRRPNRQDHDV